MKNDPALERRISRTENDARDLYTVVTDFQVETRARFDILEVFRLEAIGRFNDIDGRLDGIDGRLDRIEAVLAEVVRRLPEPA